MVRKEIILFAFPFLLTVQEGDVWLQPDRFHLARGETLRLAVHEGQNLMGHQAGAAPDAFLSLVLHLPNAEKDLLPAFRQSSTAEIGLALPVEGTQVITLQLRQSQSFQDKETMLVFLRSLGLDHVVSNEPANGDVPEVLLTQSAKLLVQVGDISGSLFRKMTRQALEIVPETNPYLTDPGGEIRFRLLFDGHPEPYAPVAIWNRKLDRVLGQKLYTEKDGTVTMRMSNDGTWMVSAVKAVYEAGKPPMVYRSNLVFGFDEQD